MNSTIVLTAVLCTSWTLGWLLLDVVGPDRPSGLRIGALLTAGVAVVPGVLLVLQNG